MEGRRSGEEEEESGGCEGGASGESDAGEEGGEADAVPAPPLTSRPAHASAVYSFFSSSPLLVVVHVGKR